MSKHFKTLQAIDRIAKPAKSSSFVNTAVSHTVTTRSIQALRARLKSAVVRDQDIDREVAGDWLAVDRQQWRRLD